MRSQLNSYAAENDFCKNNIARDYGINVFLIIIRHQLLMKQARAHLRRNYEFNCQPMEIVFKCYRQRAHVAIMNFK